MTDAEQIYERCERAEEALLVFEQHYGDLCPGRVIRHLFEEIRQTKEWWRIRAEEKKAIEAYRHASAQARWG